MPALALSAAALIVPVRPAAQGQAKPVQISTAPAATQPKPATPSDLFKGEKLRDPFAEAGAGATTAGEPEPFSIHALQLKGLLQDKAGDYAILVQPNAGATYILKKGRLYDSKSNPVPGVTGIVKPKQKTVHLMTPDKDVQTLILGEEQEGT